MNINHGYISRNVHIIPRLLQRKPERGMKGVLLLHLEGQNEEKREAKCRDVQVLLQESRVLEARILQPVASVKRTCYQL